MTRRYLVIKIRTSGDFVCWAYDERGEFLDVAKAFLFGDLCIPELVPLDECPPIG